MHHIYICEHQNSVLFRLATIKQNLILNFYIYAIYPKVP